MTPGVSAAKLVAHPLAAESVPAPTHKAPLLIMSGTLWSGAAFPSKATDVVPMITFVFVATPEVAVVEAYTPNISSPATCAT